MKIQTRATLVFMTVLSAASASSAAIKVDMLEVRGKSARGQPATEVRFKMPFVRADNAALAAQMNDDLFIGRLGMLAPKNPGTSITAAKRPEANIEGVAVSGEGGPVLSVNFEIESCGAYCENFHEIFSYDIATGRRVNNDDIFTPTGQRELARQMASERLRQFNKQLADIAATIKAAKVQRKALTKDVLSDLDERRELNLECVAREQTALADEAALAAASAYYTQQHAGKAMVLTSGRCSNHAMRALDDVGDVSITIPYAKLRPHLTDYGKTLLLGEGRAQATGIYGQLLRGYLNGNIAITMKLQHDGGSNAIDGMYIYDKVGTPIALSGKRQGSALTLTEKLGDEQTAGATLKLTVKDSQLSGQWLGKKQFSLQLAVP